MRLILWFSLICACAAYICAPIQDPDLWWHITVGRWIIANAQVPHTDLWTVFGEGQPWRAYSWSFEILVALIHDRYGVLGLYWSKLALSILIGGTFLYVFTKISKDLGFAALIAVIVLLSTFNHFTLRPQSVVWLLFALVLMLAHRCAEHGPSRSALIGLALVGSLWANLHLSAVLGLVAIFAWIVSPGRSKVALLASAAFLVGTLCTPYFGGEWLTFFQKSTHPLDHSAIAEFRAATILDYSAVFLILLGIVISVFVFYRRAAIGINRLLLLALFTVGSLAVLKFIPFATILCGAVLSSYWASESPHRRLPLAEGFARLAGLIERMPREGLSFVFICLGIVYAYRGIVDPLSEEVVPVQALDFFEKHNLPRPLVNNFGTGGYVMFRQSAPDGSVSHRVSIDGRTNLIPHSLWEKHMQAQRGAYNWKEYFDLFNPQTILWKTESPLTAILRNGSEWCHVYRSGSWDQGYSLFIRREVFNTRPGEFKSDNCS